MEGIFSAWPAPALSSYPFFLPRWIESFEYRHGKKRLLFFLFQRGERECLYLAAVCIEAVFVLCCVIFQKK